MRDDKRGYPLPDDPETDDVYCVSFQIPARDEYRLATTGAVYELAKWHNWERDPDQKARKATQLFKKLLYETFTIGECPTDPPPEECEELDYMQQGCKLYYSKDGGDTWLLMMDYEECLSNAGNGSLVDDIIINKYNDELLQELLDKWNNGERPDDGAIDSVYWSIATCLAVYAIIDAMLDGLLQRKRQAEPVDVGTIILSGITGGLGVLDIVFKAITWKMTLAVGAFASAWALFAYIGRDEIVNIPDSEFTSSSLKQELKSVMFNALKGITPSLSTYENSLNAVQPVTQNAIKIRDWIKQGLNLQSFIGYLQMVRILHDFAKAEDFQENACEQLTWSHIFRFNGTGSAEGFVSRISGASAGTNLGWISTGMTFGTYKESGCKRTLNLQQSAMRNITIEYESANPKNTAGTWAWQMSIAGTIHALPDGTGVMTHSIASVRTGTFELNALMHFRSTLANDNCRIRAFILSGTGVNPFE